MIAGEVGELLALWNTLPVLLMPLLALARFAMWGLRYIAYGLERLIGRA